MFESIISTDLSSALARDVYLRPNIVFFREGPPYLTIITLPCHNHSIYLQLFGQVKPLQTNVYMISNWSPENILQVTASSSKKFDFIRRITCYFNGPGILKTLYFVFVVFGLDMLLLDGHYIKFYTSYTLRTYNVLFLSFCLLVWMEYSRPGIRITLASWLVMEYVSPLREMFIVHVACAS